MLSAWDMTPLPMHEMSKLEFLFNNPEWVAIFVTAILALVAVVQLVFLRRSANAAKEAAEAALLNAQAVIRTERPWLVVTWISDKETPGVFRFGCRNQGNTPAKIISMSAKPTFIDLPDNLPVPPVYSSPVAMPGLHLIVSEDSFRVGHGINPASIIQNAGKKDLVDGSREFLVYCGNIVYRDALYLDSATEGLHETRWCFVYQPAGKRKFVRSGPEEYNRYS